MNIYAVVEGEVGEKKVYQHWIPLVNAELCYVDHISLIRGNNFSIISGSGYPNYFNVIEAAIEDVNHYGNIDRLVISIDSEDLSYEEKQIEVTDYLSQLVCHAEIKVIIQHFCLETWGLENKIVIRPNPRLPRLIEFKRFFDVRNNDPELLPNYEPKQLNRSKFAEVYLRSALNDKYRNLTYTKSNPEALLHHKYFERVKDRHNNTEHIASFSSFLSAFI